MEINILAFGKIAELAGKSNWKAENIQDTDELKSLLTKDFPTLQQVQYAISVNKKLTHENIALRDGDTIALLPPFSGG